MNDNKSRDIFYGVVAIATLIVALVGATLAYFSISAGSEEGAVNAKAAVVSIEYNDSQQVTASADKLIPSDFAIVKQAYLNSASDFGTEDAMRSNICLDAQNQQVCSIYRFTVSSDIERSFIAKLNNEQNNFTYLAYAVRDVTNNSWLNLDDSEGLAESLGLASCDNTDSDETNDCYTTVEDVKTYNTSPKAENSIFGYTVNESSQLTIASKNISATPQIFDIVLFLKENNRNQNVDQGKEYRGTIVIESTEAGSSGIITGKAS